MTTRFNELIKKPFNFIQHREQARLVEYFMIWR